MGASKVAGQTPLNGWIAIILYLVISPALWFYVQSELNKVWQAEADPAEGELAPPAPADPSPRRCPSSRRRPSRPPATRRPRGPRPEPPVKQRVNLITLGVGDLGRARRFYEALGWSTGAAPDDDVVFFQAGEMVLALWDRARLAEDSAVADGGGWGGVTLALNFGSPAEVDATIEEARSAGATIGREPAETFWGGYSGVFIDPDGHPWEVAHNPHWTVTESGGVELGR